MKLIGDTTKLDHVGFGKIIGMSTREGSIILLQEVLDRAKNKVLEIIDNSNTQNTKKNNNSNIQNKEKDIIADRIGQSAVVINDLAHSRLNDIEFSWDLILSFEGHTGPYLQYTRARLYQLEQQMKEYKIENLNLDEIDYELLNENDWIILIKKLDLFNDIIIESADKYEANILVQYLFELAHLISICYKRYHVNNQPIPIIKSRLIMFSACKIVLAQGLTPVYQM